MNAITKTLAALLLATSLAGTALAATLTGNSPYNAESFGQQADQGTGAYTQVFDMPANAMLQSIQWWGFYAAGEPSMDQFVVSLGDVVQTGMLSREAVTATDGSQLYFYTLDVADAPLTKSSLSIFNNSGDVEWYWQSAVASGNPGAPSANNVAFALVGQDRVAPVPEPTSLALMLAGLVVVFGAGARKRTCA